MIPGALALERGSEANAPLARAILGGLLAGEPATLFVLPALYSLFVHDTPETEEERKARLAAHTDDDHGMPIRLRRSSGTTTVTTTAPKKSRTIDSVGGDSLRGRPQPGRNSVLITLRTKTLDTTRPIHVAISGAAGRVGYSLLFRIANGGLFGHEQPIALSLLDLPEGSTCSRLVRWS